ncbi:plasmid transfer protein TraA [Streptomyces sp. NPDC058322]|uniref:plasmid transfer protein TraA n=1 Tax=Streptomyces sp. NPDC058322 TaxID=3346446 RepID=UPI0036E66DF9
MSSSVYNWADDETGRGVPRQHAQGGGEPSFPGPQPARSEGRQAPAQPSGPTGPGRGARVAGAAGAAAGGFVGGLGSSLVPPVTVNIGGGGDQNGNGGGTVGPAGVGKAGGKVPGSDFMSNEDIRAYCEHYRKKARNLATEMAMDADHLEAVLRTIPDTSGSRSGSRARARRVTRWLKKSAAAQKAQQKYFASLYGTFEREFESELRTIGKGRAQPKPRQPFGWR